LSTTLFARCQDIWLHPEGAAQQKLFRAGHARRTVKEGESVHQIVLTPEQVKLVDFAGNIGRITNSDVVDILGVPDRTALRHLTRLVEMGVLKAVGEKKARYYELA